MKKINILGYDYHIKYVDVIEKGSRVLGKTNHVEQTIELERGMNKECEVSTLIHEVLHAILFQLGYHEESDNEKLINSLSTGIFQVVKQNKIKGR